VIRRGTGSGEDGGMRSGFAPCYKEPVTSKTDIPDFRQKAENRNRDARIEQLHS